VTSYVIDIMMPSEKKDSITAFFATYPSAISELATSLRVFVRSFAVASGGADGTTWVWEPGLPAVLRADGTPT
jgi:hypothetical protein